MNLFPDTHPSKSSVVLALADIGRQLEGEIEQDLIELRQDPVVDDLPAQETALTKAKRWAMLWRTGGHSQELWSEARKALKASGTSITDESLEREFCRGVLEAEDTDKRYLARLSSPEVIEMSERMLSDDLNDTTSIHYVKAGLRANQKYQRAFYGRARAAITKAYPDLVSRLAGLD